MSKREEAILAVARALAKNIWIEPKTTGSETAVDTLIQLGWTPPADPLEPKSGPPHVPKSMLMAIEGAINVLRYSGQDMVRKAKDLEACLNMTQESGHLTMCGFGWTLPEPRTVTVYCEKEPGHPGNHVFVHRHADGETVYECKRERRR